MPLQNRVSPFGELFASPARGTLMGNRGGRLHDQKRKLTARRWVSRAWICCKLDFNNRHRKVWGDGYQDQSNYLRVYVAGLRKKLEEDPTAPVRILTEPGVGYRWAAEGGSEAAG